jgi:hypothetical protein
MYPVRAWPRLTAILVRSYQSQVNVYYTQEGTFPPDVIPVRNQGLSDMAEEDKLTMSVTIFWKMPWGRVYRVERTVSM